ncbi:MAG: hypothetical protein BGO14_11365 [Chlamydiales bacterium 38-26]|nr:acetate/propionate family kinase [Chlamydiales bacterium]OJV11545.1 MAG: hypothetical protein BGO14_11365 [Chlamydiales bacterium 38-26]
MNILVVNGGSSTYKFSVYRAEKVLTRAAEPIWKKTLEFKNPAENRKKALQNALREIPYSIDMVAHRIVHGGDIFFKPTLIQNDTKRILEKLSHLAPLHNPVNLEGIEVAESQFPQVPQIGVFDTSFHSTMPEVAWTYAGPWEWRLEKIRRYGFHGINNEYCVETLKELGENCQRVIICHLGNGASCTAVLEGKSVDTTMGFTPMEGLMMGTRSGSVDPGILIYLQREKGWTVSDIDRCLNKESGLLGIGQTSDMREILKKCQEGDERAQIAYDLYIYRLKKEIGSLVSALGGLDLLCFTGGIGENSAEVRKSTIDGLTYLPVKLNSALNESCREDKEISSAESSIKVFVIHAREDWLMAKLCLSFFKN